MIGAEVYLWRTKIGTVVQESEKDIPLFMYEQNFSKSNIEISPIMMPLSGQTYSFPRLNEETKDIRSGQIDVGEGYSYWLLKFGNIKNNKDKDRESDNKEYTKIEYAYSLMTKDAGINMTECRIIKTEEGVHFATKRFDKEDKTGKKFICGHWEV